MKTTFKLTVLLMSLFITQYITAQSTSTGIQIKDLEMPSAPALTLLDQSATTIETPQNIQALTTTLMNSIGNNNVGFEINPYMLLKERKSFYDYYNVVKDKKTNNYIHDGYFSSIYKSLSISVAKVKKDTTTSFSIGVRTNLIRLLDHEEDFNKKFTEIDKKFAKINSLKTFNELNARSNRDDYKYLKNVILKNNNRTLKALFEDLSNEKLDQIDIIDTSKSLSSDDSTLLSLANIDSNQLADLNKRRDKNETFPQMITRYKSYKDLSEKTDKEIADIYKEEDAFKKEFPTQLAIIQGQITKPLFSLDAAAAYSHIYKGNNYSEGQMGKFGAWSTANLNVKLQDDNKFYFSLYGYGRYIKDNAFLDTTTNKYTTTEYFDIGGKGEFEFHKLSVAYEYVHRTKEVDNYRSVGSIKFKYSDTITLNGGFGKNFQKTDNQVAFLGISWGIESGNNFDTTTK